MERINSVSTNFSASTPIYVKAQHGIVQESHNQVELVNLTRKELTITMLSSRIINLLEQHEIYKDSRFSLNKLAARLFTNRTYVSKCCNEVLHKSYSTLLNDYRYAEITKLIVKYPKYKRHELAEKGGFMSVSTMIRVINYHSGLFYKEWKKKVLSAEN